MSVEITANDNLTVRDNVEIFWNISKLLKESALLSLEHTNLREERESLE